MREMYYEDLLWWKAYLAALPAQISSHSHLSWAVFESAAVADATIDILRVRLASETPPESPEDDL